MPTEPKWKYDQRTHNYVRNGRFVAFSEIKEITLKAATESGDAVEVLTQRLINGELRLDHWQELMRNALKNEHISQYTAGRGGKAQMTPRDYGILGNILRYQYQFLDNFARDIDAGGMTPAQIMARARMYIENAHQSFWRGYAEAYGMPQLPTYPAHGDSTCLTRCRCEWFFVEIRDRDDAITGWEAYWRLDPKAAEVHCNDCPRLASLWNPLWVPAGMTPAAARRWRAAERKRAGI